MNKILYAVLALSILLGMSNCENEITPAEDELEVYTVTYISTEHDSGTVPTDNTLYNKDDKVTIKTSNLKKDGYVIRWKFDRQDDELNTEVPLYEIEQHREGSIITIRKNIVLKAIWVEEKYRVTYDGNGNTEGEVPIDNNLYAEGDTANLLYNYQLENKNSTFKGWVLYLDYDQYGEYLINYKGVDYNHSRPSALFFRSSYSGSIIMQNDLELIAVYSYEGF